MPIRLLNNPEILDNFNAIESSYQDEVTRFHHCFIKQSSRSNSPIGSDLIQSLLSESLDDISVIYSILPRDCIESLRKGAIQHVSEMLKRGENSPLIDNKLELIGVAK